LIPPGADNFDDHRLAKDFIHPQPEQPRHHGSAAANGLIMASG
jgi:hypothetical protein